MRFKKILPIILSLIILLGQGFAITNTSKATSNEGEIIGIKKGTINTNLIKENDEILTFSNTTTETARGVYPTYSLEKLKLGVIELNSGYNVTVSNKITDERLWRIIRNSFPYVSSTQMGVKSPAQAFIVTQTAIDIIYNNKNINNFSAMNSEGEMILSAIKELINVANNENIKFLSDKVNIIQNEDWKLEKYRNKAYISSIFQLEGENLTGRYEISLIENAPNGTVIADENNKIKNKFSKNQKFKILIPCDKIITDNKITISVKTDVATYPIYIGTPENENYKSYLITGFRTETIENENIFKYVNLAGELIINLKDAKTNKNISGATFNIYDENKKLIYKNLETDENGQIKINNLFTGTYYVEEVNSPEGYNKINDYMEINVIEGSKSNLNISIYAPTVIEEKKYNTIVEIVQNTTEKNTITENEYNKKEINNSTENNKTTNNTYIDNISQSYENISNINKIDESEKSIDANDDTELKSETTTNIVKKLPKTGM